jgi:hypothetical protein
MANEWRAKYGVLDETPLAEADAQEFAIAIAEQISHEITLNPTLIRIAEALEGIANALSEVSLR